jgi:hypothetical protein
VYDDVAAELGVDASAVVEDALARRAASAGGRSLRRVGAVPDAR